MKKKDIKKQKKGREALVHRPAQGYAPNAVSAIEDFICYLINNCEGDAIQEETLLVTMDDFLKSTKNTDIPYRSKAG